jgi:hypothetical protein
MVDAGPQGDAQTPGGWRRPIDPDPGRPWWTPLIIPVSLVVVLVSLTAGWLVVGPIAAAVIGAAGLGALVGVSELVSRYTDSPENALLTWPGVLYVLVNVLAAASAFGLTHGFDLLHLDEQSARLLTETLVAGVGAMAFFRSSVFTVRVGGSDLAVGPASFLQTIMNAVDRACDRKRARPRAEFISNLMQGVAFDVAAEILPQFCLSAMQNVGLAEKQLVLESIKQIKANKDIEDDQKSLLLGLQLLNVVGRDVLVSTINGLGPRIRSGLHVGLATVALLQRLRFGDATRPLVELCFALDQRSATVEYRAHLGCIIDAIGAAQFDEEVKLLPVAIELTKAFGDDVVASALRAVVKT